jgi:predicted RecA/RadA family phage recombinase
MKKYIQDGEVLDYSNASGSTILSGAVIVIGTLIGVAVADIADGTTGAVRVSGVVNLAKTSATVIAMGDSLDYDVSTSTFSKIGTPATGDVIACCVAAAAAGSGVTTVDVMLNVRGVTVT